MEENSSSCLSVLGVRWHPVDMDRAVGRIRGFLSEPGFHMVVTLGTEMVMRAQHDGVFRDLVNGAELVVPDGIGLVWAARYCGHRGSKVAGIELVGEVLARVPEARLFLLGAAPGVAEAAAEKMKQLYPHVTIAGCRDGFFQDDREVIAQVRQSGANVLLTALGCPRQELWMRQHAEELGVKVGIGVGGTFDVYAGRLNRAPQWMIRLGLEWLYRLVLQPSRWMRMLALPRFAMRVLLQGRRAVVSVP